jgi:hypothetical protein
LTQAQVSKKSDTHHAVRLMFGVLPLRGVSRAKLPASFGT